MDQALLTLLVLVPLAAMAIGFFMPAEKQAWHRVLGITSGLTCLSLAVYLFFVASSAGEEGLRRFTTEPYPWVDSLGIAWTVGVDGMSVVMVLLTSIVLFTGSLVSAQAIKKEPKNFFVLLNALVAGVFGVFVVRDLFFMYFAFELAVVPMFLLIAVWGSTQKEYAAMKLTLYLTAGALVALVGLLSLYFETWEYLKHINPGQDVGPTFSLDAVIAAADAHWFTTEFQVRTFALLFVGFASIIPMWPLHTWSPIGHAAAPSAGSMMHAGVLMKLGAFAVLRVAFPTCPEGAAFWLPWVGVIAMMNIMYGGLVAMAQKDMKFVIGYSSSSHMGYTLLGLASVNVVGVSGAVFLMFAHGVMTALAFSLIGFFYDQTHNRWIPDLGGLAFQMPFVGVCFTLMALASAGVPGFANFASEFMIMFGAWEAGMRWEAIVSVFGVVISAVYLLRAVRNAFWGPRNERWDDVKDARTVFERMPFVVLLVVLLVFGMYPKPLTDVIKAGVTPIVNKVRPFMDKE